jgi:hypothetical protein
MMDDYDASSSLHQQHQCQHRHVCQHCNQHHSMDCRHYHD